MFTPSVGAPVNPRNALQAYKSLIAPLPVTQIALHPPRHTAALLALARGCSLVSRFRAFGARDPGRHLVHLLSPLRRPAARRRATLTDLVVAS